MGSAVGQVPELLRANHALGDAVAHIPVIVKLTPNITNIVDPGARRRVSGRVRQCAFSYQHLNSIVGVDLDTLEITPSISAAKAVMADMPGPL